MKVSIIVLLSCLLSSCLIPLIPPSKPGRSNVELYKDYSKNRTVDEIKRQMIICGFPKDNLYNATDLEMTVDGYVEGHLCMEKKGFRSYKNKSVCHNEWFISRSSQKNQQMCQAWLKEFKR